MITCTRRIQFCSGHRVMGHENKCAHPHGHNYVAFFTARAEDLDSVGRVIDFSVLKERIGGWIDEYWDHGFIYARADKEMGAVFKGRWKNYDLPTNPTAENLADHLLRVVCPEVLSGTGVEVTKVTIWETENCYADASVECFRSVSRGDGAEW